MLHKNRIFGQILKKKKKKKKKKKTLWIRMDIPGAMFIRPWKLVFVFLISGQSSKLGHRWISRSPVQTKWTPMMFCTLSRMYYVYFDDPLIYWNWDT